MSSTYCVQSGQTSFHQKIKVIDDMRSGKGFQHYRNKWIQKGNTDMTDEMWNKTYVTYNYIDKVIDEQLTLAPTLTQINSANDKKIAIINEFLNDIIDWEEVQDDIMDSMVSRTFQGMFLPTIITMA